jgi:methionyl-tRNA formyltransferase
MVLAAFAALVPDNVLALTPGGISNVHPSLLPRWRGAAPIQAALLAGDRETGVSIIRLVSALDAGPVYAQERVPIDAGDDFLTLEPRLAKLGARLLVRVLEERPEPWPQDDSQATFCRRIERDDARIDWTQPAEVIWRQVRAYRGWPQAFTHTDRRLLKILGATPLGGDRAVGPDACDGPTPPGDNRSAWHAAWRSLEPGTLKLLEDGTPAVATGAGALRLDEVQLEGKRAMSGADFARGYPRLSGAKLA